MIGKYTIPGGGEGGFSSALCRVATTPGKAAEDACNASGDDHSAGHLAVFVISQLLMGIGTTPLYTLGKKHFSNFGMLINN